MKSISGKQLCKIVEQKGWILTGLTQNHEKTNHIRVASPLLPKGEASAKGEERVGASLSPWEKGRG
ncbi:hypothetical protein N9414_17403 [Nodularia spumigena CCY9414]|nr:hypothetical protein N9414_17403 [Nodularia spumigena CCY9414]